MKLNPLLAGMIGVALSMTIVLSLGFWLHQQPGFSISDTIFGACAALLIAAIACAIQWALMGCPSIKLRGHFPHYPASAFPFRRVNQGSKKPSLFAEFKARRIAEIGQNPARKRYIPLIEKGELWSDEQMEYNDDRSITATCPHLEQIEGTIRDEGITVKRLAGPLSSNLAPRRDVRASCRIDEARLRQRFSVSSTVNYRHGYEPERSAYDNPWAQLHCDKCQSRIELVHPEQTSAKCFPSS